MDLRQLEYVVAIAEKGNISKAADSLFITQSGLNQQLIKLEKELGVQLFHRNKHYLRMTKAGEVYVKNAREILRIKRNTYAMLGDLKADVTGEIDLGITHEHGIDLFTSVFPRFNKQYPGISFNLFERIVADQHHLLVDGGLDFGIVMLQERDFIDLVYIPLYFEQLILGIPSSHPLAEQASPPGSPLAVINLAQLKDERFSLIFGSSTMRRVIDPCFKAAGFRPRLLIETAMNHAVIQMVSYGLCCTILPESRILASPYSSNCAWFAISSQPRWGVYIAYRRDTQLSESHKYFIHLAQEYGRTIETYFNKTPVPANLPINLHAFTADGLSVDMP